jgi:tetratricopeptide (TPR) repeat protein
LAPVFDAADEAIDDKLSWLDEAAARAGQAPAAAARAKAPAADDLFADEEGFFDLAAELEEELSKEEIVAKEALAREEPSLEEIVEGFKKGVAESLSPEDYDTHFNLGIAYREMGLLDEAIGEFQLAAKHPNYLLDCCSLLGGCFLEKGLPELGVKWYQRGLATPGLSEDGNLGLLYDLGNLYLATGDHENARRTFVELYGINSNYRDVVPILEQLGSR